MRKFVNYLSLNFIEKVARILLKPRIAKIEIRFVSESKMERFEKKKVHLRDVEMIAHLAHCDFQLLHT